MSHRQAKLVVLAGPEDLGPFFLTPETGAATLGSDADASLIVLPGEGVAAVHGTLVLDEQRWLLVPAEGVRIRLDGNLVTTTREVEDLATLEIGPYKLQFLVEEVEPAPTRPPRRQVRLSNTLQASAPLPPPAEPPVAPAPTAPPMGEEPVAAWPGQEARGAPPRPDSGRAGSAEKTRKVCQCGQVLAPGPDGYTCAVCRRQYDTSGQPLKRGLLGGRAAFLTSPKTWVAAGAGVLALAGVIVVISLYARRGEDTPASEDKDGQVSLEQIQALPPQASKLLDVVVRNAILHPLFAGSAEGKPSTARLASGQALTIRIEKVPHLLRVAKAWEGGVTWEGDIPSLGKGLQGLAIKLQHKVALGEKTLPRGTVLARYEDGWYMARVAGETDQAN